MLKLILIALTLGFCSCSATGPKKGLEPPKVESKFTVYLQGNPDWETMDDVRRDLGNKVKITGNTVDLMGGKISGRKLKQPSNPQDEGSVGVKIRIKGLTLKNGVAEGIPGGFLCYNEDITFQKIVFLKAGEDFVSNLKDIAPGTRVIDCKFYGNSDSDKLLQGNDGRDFYVKGNTFSSAITGIRVQKKDAKKQGGTAQILNNKFVGIDTAVNAAGNVRVIVRGNSFDGVREKYKTDSDKVKFIEN